MSKELVSTVTEEPRTRYSSREEEHVEEDKNRHGEGKKHSGKCAGKTAM